MSCDLLKSALARGQITRRLSINVEGTTVHTDHGNETTPLLGNRRQGTKGPPSSVFNLMKVIMGSAILDLAYAMANTGIVGFGVAWYEDGRMLLILMTCEVPLALLTQDWRVAQIPGYTSSLLFMLIFLVVVVVKKWVHPLPRTKQCDQATWTQSCC